jgi:hypothetical protein
VRRSDGDKSEVKGSEVLVRKLKYRTEGKMGLVNKGEEKW